MKDFIPSSISSHHHAKSFHHHHHPTNSEYCYLPTIIVKALVCLPILPKQPPLPLSWTWPWFLSVLLPQTWPPGHSCLDNLHSLGGSLSRPHPPPFPTSIISVLDCHTSGTSISIALSPWQLSPWQLLLFGHWIAKVSVLLNAQCFRYLNGLFQVCWPLNKF